MSRRIPDAEGTAFPWWAILDPEQMMRADVYRLASMVTGPFFSRESADAHLRARRHAFGKRACVFCFSGHGSDDWRALCVEPTPGGDPAPHVAGAPDAAGGALGVGSACTYSRAWIGPCGKPGKYGRCPDHASVVCSCCGAPATGECPQTAGLVCGSPLCDDCEHDPKPGWHCAHRRKPGASGVGHYDGDPPRYYQDGDAPGKPTGRYLGENEVALTNCDSCAHDYDAGDMRRCRVVDRNCSDADRTGQWANANTQDGTGIPFPGATGCPGHSPRATYATEPTEEGDE